MSIEIEGEGHRQDIRTFALEDKGGFIIKLFGKLGVSRDRVNFAITICSSIFFLASIIIFYIYVF